MGGRLRLTKHNVNPKHMGYLLNSFNDLSESSTVLDAFQKPKILESIANLSPLLATISDLGRWIAMKVVKVIRTI